MKITPLRMDIVTRKSFPKDSLFRFVMQNGALILDKNQNMPGRGVYLSPNHIDDPRLERCFSKAFKTNVTKKMILEAING